MRETCRLCHGSLVILIMALIPSSKSQVISAAMWLRLEIIICLVLFSTGAPQLDLLHVHICHLFNRFMPIIGVFCESSHTKKKSQ